MTIRLLATLLLLPLLHAAAQPYRFTMPKMGSPFIITIYGNDSAKAASAAGAAFAQVDSLNMLFSDYADSSELNRLSNTSGSGRYVPVSPLLYDILERSVVAAKRSSGSYDITIGPVVKLWRKTKKQKTVPDSAALHAALQHCGYRFIHLNTQTHQVFLQQPGMQLDLGGIAKGYAAQYVVNYLQSLGFASVMADAGGDLAMGAPPPGHQGWHIGINLPEQTDELLPQQLQLQHQAVATSGDVYQYIAYKGKKYSHIIDPKTGMGVTFQRNVTTIAPDGATADWLATACSILSVRASMQLIAQTRGAALLITEIRAGRLVQFRSPNFKQYELTGPGSLSGSKPASNAPGNHGPPTPSLNKTTCIENNYYPAACLLPPVAQAACMHKQTPCTRMYKTFPAHLYRLK